MEDLPGSVLFACSMNSIRSPMAEAILKWLHGTRIFVDSAGVRAGDADPFVVVVMDEIGIDVSRHIAKTFDDLTDNYFDIVISLAPNAQHRAVELTRHASCELEYWALPDPSIVEGTREQKLEAYRALRDDLMQRMQTRFPRYAGSGS